MLGKKIMVVEDEWIVADQICKNLKNCGYLVSGPVSSGKEALKKAEEEKPDLVIMDIVLQDEQDGIETAEKIAKMFDIPIIYLTAHTNQTLVERAKMTKPYGYLVKPFSEEEMKSNIEIALYKHGMEKEFRERHENLEKNLRETIDAIVEMK